MKNIKKKIILFSQNKAPFRIKWLEELSKYYDVTMVHLGEYDKTLNEKYISNEQYLELKIICKYKKLLNKYRIHDLSILNNDYSMIIVDGYGYLGGLILILYLVLKKKVFIISVDGGFIPSMINNVKSNGYVKKNDNVLYKLVKRFIFSSTKYFFSTSELTDKFIKYYSNKNPICFRHYFSSIYKSNIKNFEDSLELSRKYRKELNFSDKKFYVLFTGRFINDKNIDLIFELSKYVDNDIVFVLIGGKFNDYFSKRYNECSKEKFIIIDFLKYDELVKYYYASDVYIMPTFHDVWGLVVLEAMSCGGLPIISSDMCISALSTIKNGVNGFIIDYDKSGYYKDYNVIKKYIEKINYLKSNPQVLVEMRKNNLNLIKKYSIEEATNIDVESIEYAIKNQ